MRHKAEKLAWPGLLIYRPIRPSMTMNLHKGMDNVFAAVAIRMEPPILSNN
jgi:hypothetical protein